MFQIMYYCYMMKICSKGNHEVDEQFFSKRTGSKDGLMSWCKPCVALYERDRYQNGDRIRKERNRKAQLERTREQYWQFLCSSKCLDCGSRDPEVLECDHREPDKKSFDVSAMLYSYSWFNIKKEIDKCDIVCSNCHKKRTIRQFGFWRGTMNI